MKAQELINVIILNKGKVMLKETKDDGHQVMTSKNDIIGYISEEELKKANDMMMEEIASGMVEVIVDLIMLVKKLYDNDNGNHNEDKHHGGKYDA